MNKITPLVKGFITGIIMLATTLLLIYTKQPADSGLQYIVYVLYAGGIAWTLIDYSRSDTYTGKFGDIFGQGFRCFIIITLIMVIFTAVFSLTHPEIAEEAAKNYKAELIREKNKTPAEIETMVESAKKQFTTSSIWLAVFGTLIMGSIFTAAGGALLLMRRK
jgi:MFS family permease